MPLAEQGLRPLQVGKGVDVSDATYVGDSDLHDGMGLHDQGRTFGALELHELGPAGFHKPNRVAA